MSDAICSVEGCEKPRIKRGWCEMHYWRQKRHGSLDAPPSSRDTRPPLERIDKSGDGGCWIWTGVLSRKGYGQLKIGSGSTLQAHRWAYETFVGPIPDGLELDHLCRVRNCVNPAHLEPVTRRENLARSTNPARFGILFNTCARGHPFTAENTIYWPCRPKARACRACVQLRSEKRKRPPPGAGKVA